jgi:putative aldouronate transport system permease protein
MWFVIAVTLYPFVYVLSMSISDPKAVVTGTVWLLPKGFSLQSYARVFENPDVWTAYSNTIFYTVAGTALNVCATIMAAYPLSRRTFFLRNWIMVMITITMFFSGGMIPSFLLIKELGLYNTRWALLLPGLTTAFFIIITRTFLQSIPESLTESAKIDGANDIGILVRIILPLSKPIIAVLSLFYAVGHWNSYVAAMIYLPDPKLQPMSLYLMKILVQNDDSMMEGMVDQMDRALFSVQLKYAIIIVSILPILLVYPFLQKYFVKGVMIGSLKE